MSKILNEDHRYLEVEMASPMQGYRVIGKFFNQGGASFYAIDTNTGDDVIENATSYDDVVQKIKARDQRLHKKEQPKFTRFEVRAFDAWDRSTDSTVTSRTENNEYWIVRKEKSQYGRDKEKVSYQYNRFFLINDENAAGLKQIEEIQAKVLELKTQADEIKKSMKTLADYDKKFRDNQK